MWACLGPRSPVEFGHIRPVDVPLWAGRLPPGHLCKGLFHAFLDCLCDGLACLGVVDRDLAPVGVRPHVLWTVCPDNSVGPHGSDPCWRLGLAR